MPNMKDNRRHIVLNIEEDVSDLEAILAVAAAIKRGKHFGPNGDRYDRRTTFEGKQIVAVCTRTRCGSDKFLVKNYKKPVHKKKEAEKDGRDD